MSQEFFDQLCVFFIVAICKPERIKPLLNSILNAGFSSCMDVVSLPGLHRRCPEGQGLAWGCKSHTRLF